MKGSNGRISIGFPNMLKEAGEKRAFLPEFIQYLTRYADVYLAEGYGSRLGYLFSDYRQGNPRVFEVEREETFKKNYVIILRAPSDNEFEWVQPDGCLISMLHYPTRPQRVKKLQELGMKAISLDSIVDDNNMRLVENMRAVAWNGLEVSFNVLEGRWPGLHKEDRQPFQVLVLGAGMVGKHAVEAATKLGNVERNNRHMGQGGAGSMAVCIGRNLTDNQAALENLMRQADILVDATQRRDASQPVIPNEWLARLPEHAVIADLAVDPYLLSDTPPTVRGIEGIPQGNLDKYVFHPQDAEWDESVPAEIPSQNRRTTVSCYSWPGIHPAACMTHYARQLEPLMDVLLREGYDPLSLESGYFQRALARAKLPSPSL